MPKQILVVEDEPGIRNVIVEILKDEGYTCVEAENAKQALELLEAVDFDLITLDLEMPGMNGNEFLEILSKRALNTWGGVIVVSANLNKLKSRALVKAVVAKPFHIEHLLSAVAKYTS